MIIKDTKKMLLFSFVLPEGKNKRNTSNIKSIMYGETTHQL